MALLAAVQPWCAGELTLMLVLMAVHASREFEFEFGRRARRNVPSGTLHLRVDQRKAGLCVISRRESRRTPSLNWVTTFALSAVSTLGKLPSVWNGLVAVGALVMRSSRFVDGATRAQWRMSCEISLLRPGASGKIECSRHIAQDGLERRPQERAHVLSSMSNRSLPG